MRVIPTLTPINSEPAYGYDALLVAQVQRRLGELGYYHGVIDELIDREACSDKRL